MAALDGRVALVTGAARGIGRACAEELSAHGATVGVIDLLDPSDTVAAIKATGGRAAGRTADVGDRAAIQADSPSSHTSWAGSTHW